TYTAFLSRISDASGTKLPLTAIRFSTHQIKANESIDSARASRAANSAATPSASSDAQPASRRSASSARARTAATSTSKPAVPSQAAPDEEADEDWIPSEKNRHGQWRVLGLAKDPVMNALPRVTAKIATT